jgi:hypothetical protein
MLHFTLISLGKVSVVQNFPTRGQNFFCQENVFSFAEQLSNTSYVIILDILENLKGKT